MRRSPVLAGIVLGTAVGVAGAAALAIAGGPSDSLLKLPTLAPPRTPAGVSKAGLEYRVRGTLPDLDGSARAYTLGSRPPAGSVQRLATALGVRGRIVADAGGWSVRRGNRLVRVSGTPGLPWYLSTFNGPCRLVPGTAAPEPLAEVPVSPTDCPETQPNAGFPPPRPAGLPSRNEAERIGYGVLRRAGVGRASAVQTLDQGNGWRVVVDPAVDGRPTAGREWIATVGPGGAVVQANGFLARPLATGDYPLAGTETGLERLREAAPFRLPPAPCCNQLRPTVTLVRLGLMRVGAYLVPAYLFEFADSPAPLAVPAVTDRYLEQPK